MQVRAQVSGSGTPGTLKGPTTVIGVLVGACLLGIAVAAAGTGADTTTFAIGAVALVILTGFFLAALDVPVIVLIRFAFVASFFFKGDLMLFKVNETEDPSGLNISLTLITASALLAYDLFIDDDGERVFPSSFTFLFAALFVTAAVSVLLAGPTLLGGFSLASLITSILVAYVTASHFSRRDRMRELVGCIGAGLVFTGIVAFTQFALEWPTNLPNFGTGTEHELRGTQSVLLSRVPAFMRTPTGMAWVVSSLVPIVLAPVICRVKSFTLVQRCLLFAAGFAGVVAVILSLARGSWLGLVVVIALLILFGWYRLSARERPGYFLTAAGTLVFTGLLLVPFTDRIYDRLTEDDGGATAIRVPLMETALRMIDDNPLAGVGLNGYRANMTKYDDTGIFVSQVFPNPVHNVFAHITAEIGVPGGIIFCLLILAGLFECSKTVQKGDRMLSALALGVALALVAFVISGIKEPGSLGSVRAPMRTFFLVIGIVLALSRIRDRMTPALAR